MANSITKLKTLEPVLYSLIQINKDVEIKIEPVEINSIEKEIKKKQTIQKSSFI